jgi:hypothetical protein
MALALSPSLPHQLRQLCAVEFKNSVRTRWTPANATVVAIDDGEKSAVRAQLVDACVACDVEPVRLQMLVVLKEALSADFPHNWPGVAEHVVSLVVGAQPTHAATLVGALDCLNLVFKHFEYVDPSDKADRTPLHQLIDATFPTLLALLTAANADASDAAALVRKNVAKIFYKAVMYDEPPSLRDKNADRIAPWIDALLAVLQAPLPPVRSGVDAAHSPGWAARKNVVHIFSLLMQRFSEPERDFKNKTRRVFAARFALRFFAPIVGAYLQQLTLLTEGVVVPDRFVALLLKSLADDVVPYDVAFSSLRPHIEPLITGLIFPLAQPSAAHLARFSDDPRDFLRQEFEVDHALEEVYSSWGAALLFFRRLFMSRDETMLPMVQFLCGECDRYRRGECDVAVPCGVLHVFGSCNKLLMAPKSSVAAQLPQILSTHVFPELDSASSVMRARACWTLQQFSDQIADIGADAAAATVQKLLERMRDPELPVRIMAACALGQFVDSDVIHQHLAPLVGELLQAFLAMMDEVESDILIVALQNLVEHFQDEVSPHAVSFVTAILRKFHEYADAVGDGGGDDDEGGGGGGDEDGGGGGGGGFGDFFDADEDNEIAMAARECLSAVRKVLFACQNITALDFWAQMVDVLLAGLLKYIGANANETFLEEVSQTLSILIYVPERLPPNSWSIFDPLMQSYESCHDVSRLSVLLTPLDNLIERANDGLFVDNRMERLYNAVKNALESVDTEEVMVADAVRIYESLLLCCGGANILATRAEAREPGLIDALVPTLIRDLLTRLQRTEHRLLKCTLLDTLCECFIYDVPLTLAALDQLGATDALLRGILDCDVAFFQRMHDKKVVAMGLTALLFSSPLAALPPTVRQLAVPLLAYTLRMINALQDQKVALVEADEEIKEMQAKLRAEHPHLTEEEIEDMVGGMALEKKYGGNLAEAQYDENDDSDADDDADDDADGGDDDDFGDEHGGLLANMDNIERLAAKAAAARQGDYDDADDVFGEMGLEEETEYSSPIDDIEEFALFISRFDEAMALEPQLLAEIVNALTPDDRELIDNTRLMFQAWQEDVQNNEGAADDAE